MDSITDTALQDRVQAVIADILERRRAGERLDDEAILDQYPDLAAPLRKELAKLRIIVAAQDLAERRRMVAPNEIAGPELEDLSDANDLPNTIEQGPAQTKGDKPSATPAGSSGPSTAPDADRFQKVRSLAEGGMGRVWVALDTQIHREVALKELREDRQDDESIRDRFLAEAHVTGALEHPGIVPVYALGVDSQQKPHYAMRLVRGVSLRRAINAFHADAGSGARFDRSDLRFRDLLRRVADVCVAVAYAHSRGVLHRDLKPDNVMLGKYGETYVVDWGMARVLGARDEDSLLASETLLTLEPLGANSATRYGSAMGTPGFMSPEQAAGKLDELTVATDVYSLGAILYFLLTNQPSIVADTLDELRQKVEAGDFPAPQIINPQAPPALGAACLKAMARLPEDRYWSARDLATDIEQWLADEPLLAVSETRLDKASRFARRHFRWLVPLLGAAILIAGTALLAATLIDGARRRAERAAAAELKAKERAETNFLDARDAVDQWLTGFTEALAYYPNVNDFRQRMLEQAAHRYEGFLDQARDDAALQLEAGRTYLRLGDIRRQLLLIDDAIVAYEDAEKTFERLASQESGGPAQEGLARAYGRLALAHGDLRDAKGAREAHLRAIDNAKGFAAESHENARNGSVNEYEATLADLEINYASFRAQQGEMAEAATDFQNAVKRLQRLSAEDPGRMETRISLATALLGWGQVVSKLGDSTKAREIFRQAAAYFEGAAQLTDETPRYTKLMADANLFLASSERMLGNITAEAKAYRQIIKAYERLNAQLPQVITFQEELARTQIDLGQALISKGEIEASLKTLGLGEGTFAKLRADFPSIPRFQEAHGLALDLLSGAYAIAGKQSESAKYSQSALAEFDALSKAWPDVPEYQLRTATCESHLAQVLAVEENYKQAGPRFAAASKRLEQAIALHPDVPALRYAAAAIATRWGETLALASDVDGASQQAFIAEPHWQRLVETSADPEYLAAAAWHYAAFPVADRREPLRAAKYAQSAAGKAPENGHYACLCALAELRCNRADESLAIVARLKGTESNAFTQAFSAYVAAMAYAVKGENQKAQQAYRDAVAESEKHQPGRWELRTLRRQCEEALKNSRGSESADERP